VSGTFELTDISKVNRFGVRVFRIRAVVDFPGFGVKAGDLGGWVESVDNLGYAWVFNDAQVFGDAKVSDSAKISDEAQVYGNAKRLTFEISVNSNVPLTKSHPYLKRNS